MKTNGNTTRLTPLPHLIKSIRSRHWNISGALMEWVDNSLQHGGATEVAIMIDNEHGIGIRDNGNGIDDINRVFTLGDASAYGDLSQIGQYGVGATDAMIYLGEVSTVQTVRDGRVHRKTVNWTEVENSGLWPLRYTGDGKTAQSGEVGTQIVVTKLHQYYQLKTSENVAKDLGLTFAPAVRKGTKITLHHRLRNGGQQAIDVTAFEPADLTDVISIKGSVDTLRGPLKWTGRAGLSTSLVERHNGVHIAFRHRVIEMTRDPFKGTSAPTLYVEIQLDETTPWKYQLSDHKDRVVRHRDALMDSINEAIKPLLDKASEQATNLALMEMTAQIEGPLNKAIKGNGPLFIDLDEEPVGPGPDVPGPGPVEPGAHLRTPKDQGVPAKEVPQPTGIKIEYASKRQLDGRAYAWDVNGKLLTIKLEKEMFADIINWPLQKRDFAVVHMVIGFLSHAVDMLYWNESQHLRKAVSKQLYQQIEEWAGTKEKIAPYFYKYVIEGITLH